MCVAIDVSNVCFCAMVLIISHTPSKISSASDNFIIDSWRQKWPRSKSVTYSLNLKPLPRLVKTTTSTTSNINNTTNYLKKSSSAGTNFHKTIASSAHRIIPDNPRKSPFPTKHPPPLPERNLPPNPEHRVSQEGSAKDEIDHQPALPNTLQAQKRKRCKTQDARHPDFYLFLLVQGRYWCSADLSPIPAPFRIREKEVTMLLLDRLWWWFGTCPVHLPIPWMYVLTVRSCIFGNGRWMEHSTIWNLVSLVRPEFVTTE